MIKMYKVHLKIEDQVGLNDPVTKKTFDCIFQDSYRYLRRLRAFYRATHSFLIPEKLAQESAVIPSV